MGFLADFMTMLGFATPPPRGGVASTRSIEEAYGEAYRNSPDSEWLGEVRHRMSLRDLAKLSRQPRSNMER